MLEIGPGPRRPHRLPRRPGRPRARRRARPLARAASSRRGSATAPTSSSCSATRSRSTSPRSTRRRRSSSPTSRTTSRRRSSPRASTGLPTVELWCVMVQREVADRFFAVPRTKAYGAVSVLVQLAARRTGFHPVSREVFRPRPERRLGARRLPPRAAARLVPGGEAPRHGRVRPPAEDARQLARAGGLAPRDALRRGAGRDRPGRRRPRRGARAAGVRRPRRSALRG